MRLKVILLIPVFFVVNIGVEATDTCEPASNERFTVLELLTTGSLCHPEKTVSEAFPLATTLHKVVVDTMRTLGMTDRIITIVITDRPVLDHEVRAMKDSSATKIFHVYVAARYLSRGDLLLEEIERQVCLINTGYFTEARNRPTFGDVPPKVQRCLLRIAEAKDETERTKWLRWLIQYAIDDRPSN